jgi:hypothetical protein
MKTRFKISFLILIFSFFIQSCAKKEKEARYELREINGIKVIHNFKSDIFRPIRFVEDLSIGVQEGDENYMFSDPGDMDSDSQGNIYVLDYKEVTIKKYDSRGNHIKNIGRKGQGPGEFQMPRSFIVGHKDRIYVQDILSLEIEMLSADGDYLGAVNLKDMCDQVFISPDEELIIGEKSYVEGKDKEVEYLYQVGKYDLQKKEFIPFYKQKQLRYDRLSSNEISLEIPLYVRWDIDSAGHIYVATANKYELNVFSPQCQLLFKFTKDYEPSPVEKGLKESIFKRLSSSRIPFDSREYGEYLEFYPVFKSLSVDEKDRVWVELFQPSKKDSQVQSTNFDVFSPEGKFLFSTKIDKIIYPRLIFKKGYIYTLTRNELGFSRALRLRFVED